MTPPVLDGGLHATADNGLAQDYLAQYCGHVSSIRSDLTAISKGGEDLDREGLLSRIFRAVHAVRGAQFFGLVKIGELAQQMENVLALMHSQRTNPQLYRVGILLQATDRLGELVENSGKSNQADTERIMNALERLQHNVPPPVERRGAARVDGVFEGGLKLRMLAVEDDLSSRLLLKKFLSRYGECEVAVNGREAVEAFQSTSQRGQKYDLICMDLTMPEMDGREAVRQVRAIEAASGLSPKDGAKIIIMTGVDDMKEMIQCFEDFSDAYLIKPINLVNLMRHLKAYQLIR